MNLLGIPLRKPSFGELTASAVMATGLWIAGVGMAQASGHPFNAGDAGALLVLCAWSCLGARVGLGVDHGRRHFAINLAVSASLLAAYQAIRVLAG